MDATLSEPLLDKAALIEHLEKGCKPVDAWRIGTEHEKFIYTLEDLRPLEYEGERGIRAVLEALLHLGWQGIHEDGILIGLHDGAGCSVTLEPAGQLELSGAPLTSVHETCAEIGGHLKQVKTIAAEMRIGLLGLGYHPKWAIRDLPWMPKGRYEIMRRYLPTRGSLGLDMMQATCTVQTNLDFDSETTMKEMFRISLALQPIATALFANSPFSEGVPNGYLSYRSHIWTDTDPDRCGIVPFVFDTDFGFEHYVDYMLDVPMFFVYRDGKYIDVAGQSFRDFMKGKLPGLSGVYPTLKDWDDHLTTVFPEVRLKRYLEMRGADGGPWNRLCALPAFWVGLLYDADCRRAALDLTRDWTPEERHAMREGVARHALKTPFRGGILRDIAMAALEISHAGLSRRNRLDSLGRKETIFLQPLFTIAEANFTPAEELLAAYHGRWKGHVDPVFCEYAY